MQNINWMFVLICCFLARIIATEASFPEAIAFVACISYILVDRFLENNKVKKHNAEIEDKIVIVEQELSMVKESLAAVRIGSTFGQVKK